MSFEGILADNRYRILQFIGEGGMSRVYKAEDIRDGSLVAVKFMKERVTSSYIEDSVRFKKELEIASRLNHPGIAKVFGSGEYDGALFTVMELLEGESLDKYIQKNTFGYDEIANIFYLLAEIVDYIHGSGIVHRDIKPGNFFVCKNGNAVCFKLLDFGVAHIMELSAIKDEKNIAGTFGYMSPEATGQLYACIDERSDLYSLGVIFYQLLTGEPPFKGSDIGKLLHQQVAATLVPPEALNPSIPVILSGITMKLLMKDPDSRYQSAKGLLYDIGRYIKGDREFAAGGMDRKSKLTYRTRMVGRDDEMEGITALYDRARQGKGSICLVSGEAGTGKSKLLDEFRRCMIERDVLFIGGRCLNHKNKTPYQPFRDAIDEYIGKLEKYDDEAVNKETARLRDINGDLGEILVRLNPRIKKYLGEIKELIHLEPERENQRFLSVLSDFFCNIADGGKGCVIALDDLQWADEGSISLLGEIAGRIGRSNLLIIGTYRDNEINGASGIESFIRKSAKLGASPDEIKLGKLGRNAVGKLTACLLGDIEEEFESLTGYLYEKSEGNPFFVVNILRELVENGIVYRKDGSWAADIGKLSGISMPTGIVDAILMRIGKLDGAKRELLCKAAIIGREFDITLLHSLLHCSFEKLVDMIDQAVAMQFLERSAYKGRLLFAHDRIRDAFFHMLDINARRNCHSEILKALESLNRYDPEKVTYELAHHAIEAEDSEGILKYAIPAADKACLSYANEEAVRFYTVALDILKGRKQKENERWIRVNESLIELYLLVGRYDEAVTMAEDMLPELATPLGKARLYKKIGAAYLKKADWIKCEMNIKKGLKLLGEDIPASRPGLALALLYQLAVYAANRLKKGDYSKNTVNSDEKKEVVWMYQTLDWMYVFSDVYKCFYVTLASLNISEKRIGVSKELGTSLSVFAGMFMIIPFFNRALKNHRKALDIRRKIGDEWGIAQSLQLIGSNYLWKGGYAESIKNLEESHRLFDKMGDSWEGGLVYAELMRLYIYTADYNKSMHYSQLHFSQCMLSNNTYGINAANLGKANCLIETGSFSDAGELLDKLLASTRENGLWFLYCYTLGYLGMLHIEKSQYESACKYLENAKQYYLDNRFMKDYIIFIFPFLAEAEIKRLSYRFADTACKPARGEILKARKLCKDALKRTKPWPNHYGTSLRAAAELFALTGVNEKAERLFLESIAYTERLGRKYEAAKGYFEYGMFLISGGKRPEAAECLNKALSIFREIGAKACAAKCESVLYGEGDETYPGRPTARDRLKSDRRMNTVLTTGRYISSILDQDELLEKIMDGVMELVGAERGMLLLYPEEGGSRLQAKVLHNMPGEREWVNGHTASMSIISKVEREKAPLLISDALSEENFKNKASVLSSEIRSVICVPVTVKGEMLGIIYLDNNLINGLFSEDDLDIVNILAGQAGVSIQNARMYSRMKDYLDEIESSRNEIAQWNRRLEQRVEERTEELNGKNVELASAIARLEENAVMIEELAIAKERNRFALDAHDHLGHTLTLLIKLLEVSRMTCLDAPDKMDIKLEEAARIAREGLEELRASVKGLVTEKIKGNNLSNALEVLAQDFSALGIHVELSVKGLQDLTDPLICNTLYSLCIEASTNALRHGKAKNISIIIKKENVHIRLVIFDDGCGCKDINKGFGLLGMEKRVKTLNGNIVFNSDGENGFIIHVDIPYRKE